MISLISHFVVFALLALTATTKDTLRCTTDAITEPSVFGAEIVSISTTEISNYEETPGNDICYVIVTVTHPGTSDSVRNYIALPMTRWNGIFQGIGGGGYAAATLSGLGRETALEYSAGATDAGHNTSSAAILDTSPWALVSPGNPNQYLLLNFAHRSLHDTTVIGKAISESFYGSPVKYSYWNGCSTGKKVYLKDAQVTMVLNCILQLAGKVWRWLNTTQVIYDGILANAPAIQWSDFTMAQRLALHG